MHTLQKCFLVVKLPKYVMKRHTSDYERAIAWTAKILSCYETKHNSNLLKWCASRLFVYSFKKDTDKERNIILNPVVKGQGLYMAFLVFGNGSSHSICGGVTCRKCIWENKTSLFMSR